MGCALGCLALLFPRLALFLVWLLGPDTYLSAPFPHIAWPAVGFFLLPTTTLAFAYASNSIGARGEVTTFGWLLVGVAVLIDAGLIGGGARSRRRRKKDDD